MQRLCSHHFAGTWGRALSGMWYFPPRSARPVHLFLPENCHVCPSSYWQCSQWKRGLEEVGRIQLLTQVFQAQHKRALDFQLAEKKRRTSRFYSSQANSMLHALCLQLTQRGRVMGNSTSTHPPSAMQKK